MISVLLGKVFFAKYPTVVIMCNNVGYEVYVTLDDFTVLSASQQEHLLYTHLVIRDDNHSLYGFSIPANKQCFKDLIKVSGVGPKVALTILSSFSHNEIYTAIERQSPDTFIHVPGIGKKLASRILLELKDKISADYSVIDNGVASNKQDIISALDNLGYNDKQIQLALKNIDSSDVSIGIKQALSWFNRGQL